MDTVGSGGRRAGSGGGVWCKVLWDKEEGQSGKYLVGWTGMFDLCIVEEVIVAIIITTSAMIASTPSPTVMEELDCPT